MTSVIELRGQVAERATLLEHPYKTVFFNTDANVRLRGKAPTMGRLIYAEGGAVGGLFDGKYLVARGSSHDLSLWALARHLEIIDWGPPVEVDEVDAGWFWLFSNPEGKTPAEQ